MVRDAVVCTSLLASHSLPSPPPLSLPCPPPHSTTPSPPDAVNNYLILFPQCIFAFHLFIFCYFSYLSPFTVYSSYYAVWCNSSDPDFKGFICIILYHHDIILSQGREK